MDKLKAILVEDEMASSEYLKGLLLQHFPHIQVVAVADSVPGAIAAIRSHNPDILFLDIEIKLGSGFDVLSALHDLTAEIIFTTAFDHFALHAFRYHAFDYLLKPLEEEQFVRTVQKCLKHIAEKASNRRLSSLLQHLQQQRITISSIDGIEVVHTDQILFAEAKGNYTELKLKTGAKITATKKLKDIEDSLPDSVFCRVHNSYIINLGSVKKYYRGRGGHVLLTDETSIPVSEARKDDFLKLLGA